MRKSRKKEPAFRGEITAFLALLFILMLSLVGALVESASIQISKNRKRADTILALESTFAEYDKEMLERYDLFVRQGCSEDILRDRMEYYGATNITHDITKHELLTDHYGQPFYEQAVRYAKNWLGIEDDTTSEPENDFSSESDLMEEEELVSEELQNLLEQEGAQLPQEGNPLSTVRNLKNASLITLVAGNPEELSNRSITVDNLPSKRTLQTGNYEEQSMGGVADKVFFAAYVSEHFTNMTDGEESHALLYEQEYLIAGNQSDKENLEQVCKQILKIRMAANYVYLLSDTVKQAEAEAMALSLCSLLTAPGITVVVKHAILLAWAYGESIVDVRVLLKGNKVPVVKTAETWQLQLANLVKLGTDEEVMGELDTTTGLGYQDYLKGLLFLKDEKTLSMRSLDLIESNLQIKTDECMTRIEIESYAEFRRGVTDTFTTTIQYQ